MPLPKLSLLQSRLAASLIASLMLLMLYFTFLSHNFAYAADVDSLRPEDHNHERLLEIDMHRAIIEDHEIREDGVYQADFLGYDEGIIGRAATSDAPTQLENNIPRADNLAQGQTNFYVFPSTELGQRVRVRDIEDQDADTSDDSGETDTIDPELRLRQRATSSQLVYISVNVCSQPTPVQDSTTDPPPQLQLYISQTDSNPNPGPGSTGAQESVDLVEGATMYMVNTTSDIYLGLYGANNTAYKDMWSTEIAASTNNFYHTYAENKGSNLRLVDSDSSAALVVTGNLTNENSSSPEYQVVMDEPPPYVLFASNTSNRAIQGLQNSYCGLLQNSEIKPLDTGQNPGNVQASLTSRGSGTPKQQFYVTGLNSGVTYSAILAVYGGGNSTSTTRRAGVVQGGGQVWPAMNFTTLSDGNCAVIFNLSFCDQTAYAVPTNPNNFTTMGSLASFYDNAATQYFQFFQNSLAQIPCNTTSSAQYSLARTCDDCVSAYKDWLCAVTIPRCTDFSSDLPWLQPRSMINPFPNGTTLSAETISFANQSAALSSSRYPPIDQVVMPGPYKEILPCDDLCYGIVQSCPSSMQFGCPLPGRTGFNASYGLRSSGGQLTCNFPGAEFDQSFTGGSGTTEPRVWIMIAMVVMILGFV